MDAGLAVMSRPELMRQLDEAFAGTAQTVAVDWD
jgi:hypothetical protein